MDSSKVPPGSEQEMTAVDGTVPPVKTSIRIRRLDRIETTGEKATGNSNS
jgi:hypothetical protein